MCTALPWASAYVKLAHLLCICSDTNDLGVCDAGSLSFFAFQVPANVLQVVYLPLFIGSDANGLCLCDACCLSLFAFQASANVLQVVCVFLSRHKWSPRK